MNAKKPRKPPLSVKNSTAVLIVMLTLALVVTLASAAYAGIQVTTFTLSASTPHGVMLWESSNTVTPTAVLTNGQLLVGSTGADPVPATLAFGTGGSAGLSASTGAGTLTLNGVTMTGDSGSGGVQGMVPAPGSGDAAAGKFLKADATWAVPSISSLNGITRTISAKTSNYNVLSGDSQKYFSNAGASAEVDFTLPTAAAGLEYQFIIEAAQIVKIIAGSSTTIQVGGSVSTAAGSVTASAVGATLHLVATSTTTWYCIAGTMTWTTAMLEHRDLKPANILQLPTLARREEVSSAA